jgi:hypothetical protein
MANKIMKTYSLKSTSKQGINYAIKIKVWKYLRVYHTGGHQ